MRISGAKAVLTALALLPVLAAPAGAGTAQLAARGDLAAWTGIAEFNDCGSTTVCFNGYSVACVDAVSVLIGSLPSCRTDISASYSKQKAGPAYVCAGIGSGTLHYSDSAGTTYAVPIVVAASEGVITYSGRWVDAFGHEAVAVQGTVHGACPLHVATWDGAISLADV